MGLTLTRRHRFGLSDDTDRPLGAGAVAIAAPVPSAVAGLLMGSLMDRVNRRTVTVRSDVISAVALMILPMLRDCAVHSREILSPGRPAPSSTAWWSSSGALPEPPRRSNGYRDYAADHLVALLRISQLTRGVLPRAGRLFLGRTGYMRVSVRSAPRLPRSMDPSSKRPRAARRSK